MSRLFADVQKCLQISIFSLKALRGCSLLFAWVAAQLLHTERARQDSTCGLLIRSHFTSWTYTDTKGHAET